MTEKGIVFRPLFVVQSNSRTEPLAKLYKKSQFISQANTVSHFTNDLNCRVTKPVLIRRTLLARTTPLDQVKKKSLGMSIFLIDLRDAIANGMEVKPIPNMVNHETNELFFDNLEIPADNLIGEENAGWRYAKFLLENERTASAYLPQAKQDMNRLREMIGALEGEHGPLSEDPVLDSQCAELELELAAHEMTIYRILTDNARSPSAAAASMIKIRGARLQQRLSSLWNEVLGVHALPLFTPGADSSYGEPGAAGAMSQFLIRRAVSIYGGTNEIQHSIIAKRGLHL